MGIKNPIWSDTELAGHIEYDKDIAAIVEKNAWHRLFESSNWLLLNPADEVIDFYQRYVDNPPRHVRERIGDVGRKVHDLGCGGGRHMYYFAERGFDVTGSDLSKNALKFTAAELDRRGMTCKLVECPMTELPFADGEFDITISRATINHSTLQDLKRIVFEMARTTRSGGLLFVTFSSERASDWKRGIEVLEDVTYIPDYGPEKGLVHTYLNAANTAALLEPFFRIEEVYLYEHPPLVKAAPGATDPKEYFGSEYVAVATRR